MNKQTTTKQQPARESDGRFALELKTNRAVNRDLRRQQERDARIAELIELYGDDWCMYAWPKPSPFGGDGLPELTGTDEA